MLSLTRILIISFVALGLLAVDAPIHAAIVWMDETALVRRLGEEPMQLHVPPVRQSELNSCGEAAILMSYSYADPHTPLDEASVIRYAESMGYYTPSHFPYTSPANMVSIARHFAGSISSGTVLTSDQGLSLLDRRLQQNSPVIIDIRTRLYDPKAGAHFVVVTGVWVDAARGNAIMIHYNDPLTGGELRARWAGSEGIWNAWKNNGDPGGSGWWLAIPPAD